jgi:hypothetical protein
MRTGKRDPLELGAPPKFLSEMPCCSQYARCVSPLSFQASEWPRQNANMYSRSSVGTRGMRPPQWLIGPVKDRTKPRARKMSVQTTLTENSLFLAPADLRNSIKRYQIRCFVA